MTLTGNGFTYVVDGHQMDTHPAVDEVLDLELSVTALTVPCIPSFVHGHLCRLMNTE